MSGNGSAVDLDKRSVAAVAVFVDLVGDNLFAYAGFPGDQNSGVRRCHMADQSPDVGQRSIFADHLRRKMFFGIFGDGLLTVFQIMDFLNKGIKVFLERSKIDNGTA